MSSVLAVLAGYVVFGASAGALFAVTGQDPHTTPTALFMVAGTAYGVAFAILGGWLTARLAPSNPTAHVRVVALVIGGIGLASLAFQYSRGSVWSELATVLVMAPSTLVGTRLAARR